MRIRRATAAFAVFAIAISVGCIRLGFWQLDRLAERRASNALIIARLRNPVVPFASLRDSVNVRFTRAAASGTYDFGHEFVLTGRSRHGSPGIHVITPMHAAGTDTVILVNRGWVYAPDAMRVNLAPFREDSSANVDGFVEEFSTEAGPVSTPSVERGVRRLVLDSIAARLPYPVARLVLVQQQDSSEAIAVARATPVRIEPPPLDEGPHRAYAIQWFGFALVGVVGTILVVQRDRTRGGHETAVRR